MPSHKAATLKGDWRMEWVDTGDRPVGGMLLLIHVTQCHAAWNALTSASRSALIRLGQDHRLPVHTQSREALERHGLLETGGPVTAAGREVLRYRPGQRHPPQPSYLDVEVQPAAGPAGDVYPLAVQQ